MPPGVALRHTRHPGDPLEHMNRPEGLVSIMGGRASCIFWAVELCVYLERSSPVSILGG